MYTQDHKTFSIKTPLGKDTLLLAKVNGQEGVSEMFQFDLFLLSEQHAIPFEDIIGKNVTISISMGDDSHRFLNGIISCFSQEYGQEQGPGGELGFSYYTATMVPWLWLLTRTTNSRIFQNLTVQEIVEQVFQDKEFTDFRFRLSNPAIYEPREYTVQYRETDFNFVSRLLEQEGIHYFFEHEDGKHTLIMADFSGANLPCPGQSDVRFKLSHQDHFGAEDKIETLQMQKQIQAGKVTLKDYNFKIPNTSLVAAADTTHALGPGEREKYDYPGIYTNLKQGESLTALRMEEEESRIAILSGTSDCRAFITGFRFTLKEFPSDTLNNKAYLLTRILHTGDQTDTYFTDPAAGIINQVYTNRFECIAHETPFRPPIKTAVPVVEGVQTAVVVGPPGQEIYTDEHGRIKVKFHWDRKIELNENSSCWLRVSQAMAGNGWGAIFLPRIGHEVIVEFIEGNPDRPIVTGQVYHGTNRPPYKLPDEKTKTTFKSNSTPDGGGFNEIRFEDKKGKEQVFIHAERNQDIRTKADRAEWVGRESHLIVVKDQMEMIYENKHVSVLGDHNQAVNGTVSLEAGMDVQEKAGMKYAMEAGQEIHLKAGMKLILEAGIQISMKVGENFIDIGPSGVTIQGMMVKINSGGAAGSGSGASPDPPRNPREADTDIPGKTVALVKPPDPSPQAQALADAAESGTPLCDR